MKPNYHVCLAVVLTALIQIGGCPGDITIDLPGGTGITIPLPGSRTVRVEVFNDTDFEIDPRIRFDDDNNWFASLAPSEELATGFLEPGELFTVNMDCDEVGVIFSDTAGQFSWNDTIGQADSTRKLERDDDFDCGDIIQFHFIGEGDGFGVNVSINSVVVN
ncbi:MAG: hypothetical protein KAY37_02340 [Phycisphaerae bacterium]|nr:hypothetical protein [Phycisphaerae bacterium]